MKLICFNCKHILYVVLILIIDESSSLAAADKKGSHQASISEVNPCGQYAYNAVKPLLGHIRLLKTELESNKNETSMNKREIEELREKLVDYKATLARNAELINQIDFFKKNNDLQISRMESIANELHNLNSQEMAKYTTQQTDSDSIKFEELNHQLEELKYQLEIKDQQMFNIKEDVKKCEQDLIFKTAKPILSGCPPFLDSSGVHKIYTSYSFDALCDSEIEGPGWTVIQQQIDGKENFIRNWSAYCDGFGSFEGDFFLGLEKIYHLTNSEPHELYIHLEYNNGISKYARYNKFSIADKSDKYRLSISGFSGTYTDSMSKYSNNQKFSTYDTKLYIDSCGEVGWWNPVFCDFTTLHNFNYLKINPYWEDKVETVRMLIRPIKL